MGLRFSWDSVKAEANFRKHRVSFEEAATTFADAMSLTIPDPLHSVGEARYVLLGRSAAGRLLVVVQTERGDTIQIISARLANRAERKSYEATA